MAKKKKRVDENVDGNVSGPTKKKKNYPKKKLEELVIAKATGTGGAIMTHQGAQALAKKNRFKQLGSNDKQ